MPRTTRLAKLALEDGTVYSGRAFGAAGETFGEVVFNTSMTGYQEVLTDPSYKGQIVTMTYPLIGNYGINREDFESKKPHVAGFVIKELSPLYSNWRALVRKIRITGAMRGILSTEIIDDQQLVDRARSAAQMTGADWVRAVKP